MAQLLDQPRQRAMARCPGGCRAQASLLGGAPSLIGSSASSAATWSGERRGELAGDVPLGQQHGRPTMRSMTEGAAR